MIFIYTDSPVWLVSDLLLVLRIKTIKKYIALNIVSPAIFGWLSVGCHSLHFYLLHPYPFSFILSLPLHYCIFIFTHWVEWQWNRRAGYWAIRFSVRSHRSLIRFALHCSLGSATHCSLRSRAPLRTFVCSFAHSLLSSWERGFCLWNECVDFMRFQPTVHCFLWQQPDLWDFNGSRRVIGQRD